MEEHQTTYRTGKADCLGSSHASSTCLLDGNAKNVECCQELPYHTKEFPKRECDDIMVPVKGTPMQSLSLIKLSTYSLPSRQKLQESRRRTV